MTVEGKAGAGRRSSPRMSVIRPKGWGRIVLSVVVAFGLGWLVPVGGLATASASAVHHGDHRWGDGHGKRGGGPGYGRGHGLHRGRSVTGSVTAVLGGNEFRLVTESGLTLDVTVSSTTTFVEPGAPRGTTIGFDNIAVGDKVQVRGTEAGPGAFDATMVKLPQASAFGTVQAVGTSAITLSPGRSTLTSTSITIVADVSSSTVYKDPGVSNPSLGDVMVGDVVLVRGTQTGLVGGTLTIDASLVFIPLVRHVGIVGNLGPNGFTLTSTSSTMSVTVDVTSTTRYIVPGVSSPSLSNLANGDRAKVIGDQEGAGTVSALLVRVLGVDHFRGHQDGHGGDHSFGGSNGSSSASGNGGHRGGDHNHGDGQDGGPAHHGRH